MSDTYKCPHCGAVYEVSREDTVADEKEAATCQVCGKAMNAQTGSMARYELIRMPDGTDV